MRSLLIAAMAVLFSTVAFAQQGEVVRLSEPVTVTESYEVFGSEVADWEAPVTLSALIADQKVWADKEVTVKTEVAEVCQKKGCFFIAQDGDQTARVTFKDYGFFVPTDSQGKKVTLVGTFSVNELSEEKAKHYAEDAGEDPDTITGPQKEYAIVATSVLVPKK
ncbi:DUF4920 domain-containing protein [Gracilimonas mengyeensis]|uniref:DUF4920 domain-containing protein n=1 Tax=Gracilimonas mengyeensis TaxID=1302730 RepID=A0A521ART1_9BACT|nr:DUF4920 domain-containing protein [Gracilimonas mengyeensis]SMO37350.1 protein of unknown function [Gracilimonas mengyeensis]